MGPLASEIHRRRLSLAALPIGAHARVHSLEGDTGVCARLREMGFCESATVAKIAGQKTLLCQVCGTRIALSERAATHVVVELTGAGA